MTVKRIYAPPEDTTNSSMTDLFSNLIVVLVLFVLVFSSVAAYYAHQATDLYQELSEAKDRFSASQEKLVNMSEKRMRMNREIYAMLAPKLRDKVTLDPETFAISISSELLFETNSSAIDTEQFSFVDALAEAIYAIVLKYGGDTDVGDVRFSHIEICGHCDPRADSVFNRRLGADRACALIALMLPPGSVRERVMGPYVKACSMSYFSPAANVDMTGAESDQQRLERQYKADRRVTIELVMDTKDIENTIAQMARDLQLRQE